VAIYLAPRRLALVRRAGWLRPRVLAATELDLPGGTDVDHGPVLARLAEALAEPTWHGASARVVVADHPWARYGIVPWPGTRLDEPGRLALARFVLCDTYGEAAADWAVALADTPPGRSYVACGMPAGLRGALEDVLAPARLRLVSLQPRLIVAFNAWRHRLPSDDTWFVSVDDGSLSAVHLSRGAWDRVHLARLTADWSVELERLYAFARLTRAAGPAGRMFVHAPDWMRRGVAAGAGIEWLEEGARDGASAHELALLQGIYA
jgi:hypothetical protein